MQSLEIREPPPDASSSASCFISIDVAHRTDGVWSLVEVGDGGVSGPPVGLDPERFFGVVWTLIVGARPGGSP